MNSFIELIRNRRSTRNFTEELLTPGEVELLLKAALMAPSSKGKNPWQFVVVEDKETLKKLSLCKDHGASFLEGCMLAIVVLADGMLSDVWIEDSAIAAVYIQLQAEDLGLGSCWAQVRGRYTPQDTDTDEYVRRLLNVPYQLQVLSVIGIGHKAQERKPFDEANLQWEKIHIGSYTTADETKNNAG